MLWFNLPLFTNNCQALVRLNSFFILLWYPECLSDFQVPTDRLITGHYPTPDSLPLLNKGSHNVLLTRARLHQNLLKFFVQISENLNMKRERVRISGLVLLSLEFEQRIRGISILPVLLEFVPFGPLCIRLAGVFFFSFKA